MRTPKTLILGFFFTLAILSPSMGQKYKPKKVPGFPMDIQSLARDIHKELLNTKKPLSVGDRDYFALDSRDPNMFEFMAYRNIGKSGERSVRFIILDGKACYAREIDAETAKVAQGILYNDMKDRWEKYLKAKERESE